MIIPWLYYEKSYFCFSFAVQNNIIRWCNYLSWWIVYCIIILKRRRKILILRDTLSSLCRSTLGYLDGCIIVTLSKCWFENTARPTIFERIRSLTSWKTSAQIIAFCHYPIKSKSLGMSSGIPKEKISKRFSGWKVPIQRYGWKDEQIIPDR